jgi:hypothetical protein
MISQKFGFLFLMLIFADPDHTMVCESRFLG